MKFKLVISFFCLISLISCTEPVAQNISPYDQVGEELFFGLDTSCNDNFLAVCAWKDGDYGTVFTYKKENNDWVPFEKLTSIIEAENTYFGKNVAVSESRLVIIEGQATQTIPDSSFVHIYTINETEITHEQTISFNNSLVGSLFANSVILTDNDLFISAHNSSLYTNSGGVVFHYKNTGSVWTQTNIISPEEPILGENFGNDIAITNNELIICARNYNDVGAIYTFVYNETENTWNQLQLLETPNTFEENFGTSLACNEENLVINSFTTGKSFIYHKENSNWILQREVNEDSFGFGISAQVFNQYILIGDLSNQKILVLEKIGNIWEEITYINYPYQGTANYGFEMCVNTNELFVSAPRDNSGETLGGSIYMYSIQDFNQVPQNIQNLGTLSLQQNFTENPNYDLNEYFQDPDNDELSFSLDFNSNEINANINSNHLTIENVPNWYGITEIVVKAQDNSSIYSCKDTLTVEIIKTNSLQDATLTITKLDQNFPNPVCKSIANRTINTTISYNLKENTNTKVSIYNIKGQLIRRIIDQHQNSGKHTVNWDCKDETNSLVSSGVYFIQLKTKSKLIQRKMLITN